MGNTFYFQWEVALMEWLQSVLGSAGASIMSFFSMLGEELIMIGILGFLYWSLNKEAGIQVGTSLIMNVTWNPMIKNVALRRRPYFDNPGVKCLKPVDADADIYDIAKQGYSFPSGHSSNSATVYGSIARFFKEKWLTTVCLIVIALVGISRFCVGVHYPTDVLCGWALGAIIVFLVPWLRKKIKSDWAFYGLLLLTVIPGIFYCKTTDYFTGLGMMIGFFLGVPFERKFVNFENTRKPLSMILRVIGGVAIYLGRNVLLKLPFSSEFLATESAACFAVRVVRYAIILFIEIGIYPMLFKTKLFK